MSSMCSPSYLEGLAQEFYGTPANTVRVSQKHKKKGSSGHDGPQLYSPALLRGKGGRWKVPASPSNLLTQQDPVSKNEKAGDVA